MNTRIGFIGLGAMGAPMAANLLKAGYPLTVYNRTRERAEPLAATGATVAESPAAVARQSDIVITMVSDTDAVTQMLLGAEGVAQGLAKGSVVIDMSTIAAQATQEIARTLRQSGIDFLDAPVSGGVTGASAGTLSIMVGGDTATFERCLPVLQTMGKKITLMGSVGMGQITKLVNQIIGLGTLVAVAEGLRFAEAAGADLSLIIETVGAGAAASWQLANTGKLIAAQDWRPGFRAALALKDMRLVLAEADQLGVILNGAPVTMQIFEALVKDGKGDLGIQAAKQVHIKGANDEQQS